MTDDDADDGSTLALTSMFAAVIEVLEEEIPGITKRIQERCFERIEARGGVAAEMAKAMLGRLN